MTAFTLKIAFAFAFSAGSAIVYRLLAKGRKNVHKEAWWIFLSLLFLSLIRVAGDLW